MFIIHILRISVTHIYDFLVKIVYKKLIYFTITCVKYIIITNIMKGMAPLLQTKFQPSKKTSTTSRI